MFNCCVLSRVEWFTRAVRCTRVVRRTIFATLFLLRFHFGQGNGSGHAVSFTS